MIQSVFAVKDWRAGILDASASDWVTVLAYIVAALVAMRAALSASRAANTRERLFWSLTAALLIFLGVNELFDLQTLITTVGKSWARADGWYAQRRVVQLYFVIALGVAALIAGLAMLWLTKNTHKSVRLALIGLVFIGVFVMIRAASMHHIDRLLVAGPNAFDFGSMQEMAGILIVGFAAYAYTARSHRPVRGTA